LTEPELTRPSVFLSYASEDRAAARMLRDALPGYGLDVWYDESELGGGDAWDQKIRRQIRDCDFFMPLVSAQTERRHEGYFRREWRLAVERTLDMADDHLFLLPLVIDDTHQASARVPEKFLTVQWLKVPDGRPTPALEAMCRRIAAGGNAGPTNTGTGTRAERKAGNASNASNADSAQPAEPVGASGNASVLVFPVEAPGQKVRFWFEVAGWLGRSVWLQFKRLPRWVRVLAYIWLAISLMSRCDASRHDGSGDEAAPHRDDITPAKIEKLKTITKQYQASGNTHDIAKLAGAIAKEFGSDDDDDAAAASPLLAFAFTAPPGDTAGAKLADSAFAMAYGMIEISHHGEVGLTKEPLTAPAAASAVARGKAAHAAYVLYGEIDESGNGQKGGSGDGVGALEVTVAKVADASVIWSKSYPAAGADPAKIAGDINANLPSLKQPETAEP
jgi:hypothetical protein